MLNTLPSEFYTWIIMAALFFIAFILALAIFERKKKRGEWIQIGVRNDLYECNLCNGNVTKKRPYCPVCGHPMKE